MLPVLLLPVNARGLPLKYNSSQLTCEAQVQRGAAAPDRRGRGHERLEALRRRHEVEALRSLGRLAHALPEARVRRHDHRVAALDLPFTK